MTNRSPFLLASLLLTTTAFAQSVVVPPSAATTLGGSSAGFPFSYTNYVRYQQAIDQKYIKTGFIHGMAFRSRINVLSIPERQFQGMRVILADLTASSVSNMGTDYDKNLASNKVEVFKGTFNIYRPNPADQLEFNVTVPFFPTFLYLGTAPLVVDMMPTTYEQYPSCGSGGNGTSMDGTRDTGIYSMFGKGSCGTGPTTGSPSAGGFVIQFFQAPMLMPFGKGCPGTGNVIPQIGSKGTSTLGGNFSFELTGAPAASKRSVFIAGLSNTLDGATRLPFDLSAATSASGCWQNCDTPIVAFLPVVAGASSLPVVIPNTPAAKGLEVFSQFAVDDPGIGGFTVTQGGVIRPQ